MANEIGFDLAQAAAAIGQSTRTIRRAIDNGELTPKYPNRKPLILREDLEEWARLLPVDPPGGK